MRAEIPVVEEENRKDDVFVHFVKWLLWIQVTILITLIATMIITLAYTEHLTEYLIKYSFNDTYQYCNNTILAKYNQSHWTHKQSTLMCSLECLVWNSCSCSLTVWPRYSLGPTCCSLLRRPITQNRSLVRMSNLCQLLRARKAITCTLLWHWKQMFTDMAVLKVLRSS